MSTQINSAMCEAFIRVIIQETACETARRLYFASADSAGTEIYAALETAFESSLLELKSKHDKFCVVYVQWLSSLHVRLAALSDSDRDTHSN